MSNVPALRFKEFSGEWDIQELGTFTSVKTGNKDTQNKEEHGKYPFFVRSNTIERINTYSFDGEAILTAGDGVGVGKVFHYLNEKFDYHQRVYNIHNFDKNVVGKYIFYYFSDKFYKRVFRLSAKNSVDSVRMDMISKMPIPFPEKQEQEKIASFLSAVDKKQEALSKKLELLKAYKKGVMQKIFSGEIRFKADDGSEFPEWKEKYGNEVFINSSNKNHNSDLPILAISQKYGAIPRDMINYKMLVTEKSVASYKVVDIGDFIISLRSFQGGLEYSSYKGICSPAYNILKPFVEIESKFFKDYFKTHNYIQELNKRLEGIRDGKMISYKYFSEIKIPFPSMDEQKKIASFLQSIDNKIKYAFEEVEKIKQFKKALLQQMFV